MSSRILGLLNYTAPYRAGKQIVNRVQRISPNTSLHRVICDAGTALGYGPSYWWPNHIGWMNYRDAEGRLRGKPVATSDVGKRFLQDLEDYKTTLELLA